MAGPFYVDTLPIPDGVTTEGYLRLCVQLMPTTKPHFGGAVALDQWPLEIAKRMSMRLWVASYDNKSLGTPRMVGTFTADGLDLFELACKSASGQIKDAAQRTWESIFAAPGFSVLGDTVDPTSSASTLAGVQSNDSMFCAPTAELDRILTESYDALLTSAVVSRQESLQSGNASGPALADPTRLDAARWCALAPAFDFAGAMQQHAAQARGGIARMIRSAGFRRGAASIAQPRLLLADVFEARAKEIVAAKGNLLSSAAQPAFAATMASLLSQLALASSVDGGPDPLKPPPDEALPTPEETARRKLSGIISFPTLAKYLGLCTDILIPADALQRSTGALAVEICNADGSFDNPTSAQLQWTAFACRVPKTRKRLYFGPWDGFTDGDVDDLAGHFLDGIINLQHQIKSQDQYCLGTAEVANTTFRIAEKLRTIQSKTVSGRAAVNATYPIPDRTTKGIILYDRFAKVLKSAALIRDEYHAALQDSAEPLVNEAAELIHALRFDVMLLPAAGPPISTRWRSLMSRYLSYDPQQIDPAFLTDPRVQAVARRDEAAAMSPVSLTKSKNADTRSVAMQELMQWNGGSLAIAAKPATIPIYAENDLALNLTFNLFSVDDKGASIPPLLRNGRAYRVRARPSLPMGCGLSFKDVQDDPGVDDYTLPKGQGGLPFQFFEPIAAPEVLLGWDDPLVTTRENSTVATAAATQGPSMPGENDDQTEDSAQAPLAMFGGRSIRQMVVRNTNPNESDRRFIVPARLSQDKAEQRGQFDQHDFDQAEILPGAFEGAPKIALYGPDGSFPEARGGAIAWYEMRKNGPTEKPCYFQDFPNGISDSELQTLNSRGPVLILDDQAFARQRARYPDATRFYPDRFARVAIATFVPVPGYSEPAGQQEIFFWDPGDHPNAAEPCVVELHVGRKDMADPASFAAVDEVRIRPGGGGRPVSMRRLSITVRPADMIDLELHAGCHEPGFTEQHHAGATIADALSPYGNVETLLPAALGRALSQTTYRRTVRLVHAVERPLARPDLRSLSGGVRYGVHAVTVTVRPEDSAVGPLPTWSGYLSTGGQDPFKLKSAEGGVTTFFVGRAGIHGRSSGRLRCEAQWADYGPSSINQDRISREWILKAPVQFAQLLAIGDLGSQRDEQVVDLTFDETGKARGLSYTFQDGRARKLQIRAVATSRFTDYFVPKPASASHGSELGRFDIASNDFSDDLVVWTECTFRPPPPVVDRVIPVFHQNSVRESRGVYSFERRSVLRVFLDPAWYASGQEEKLGIVFDRIQRPTCDYETENMEAFSRYLTRWGRDPIRITAPVGDLTPADIECEAIVRDQLLFAGTPEDGLDSSTSPLPVDVAVIEPTLDSELGLYCDIALQGDAGSSASYSPFLQLGLVRYQAHSVQGLSLSRPLDYTVQILPDRAGRAEFLNYNHLRITVSGPTYLGDSERGPRLNVRVLESEEIVIFGHGTGKYAWVPVQDYDGTPIEAIERKPDPSSTSGVIWTVDFTLPDDGDDPHYGVLIEEYELMGADADDLTYGADVTDLAGKARKLRGPVFGIMIDLA